MKCFFIASILFTILLPGFAQVDTTYIYNGATPYGTLDLRIAKSDTRYYYLQEGVTFSYRESSPGVRTNTYRDMTAWDSSPYSEGNLREKDGNLDHFVMNYRLLKPLNYNAGYEKGYPIILMMHGSGEHGNCWNKNCYHATPDYTPDENTPAAPTNADHKLLNNDHNLLHGGKAYLDAVNLAGGKLPDDGSLAEGAFPGFVLFPQNLNGWSNSAVQDAIRIVRLLVKKYNIDEDRIYINGLSNGAHGVFEALKRAPWMFSSAIVMSAVDDGFITNVNMESTIAHIPVWFFQGELDQQPTPAKTRGYIRKFRDAGVFVRYTEYEGVGHTTWNKAYNEPDFFSWMLGRTSSMVQPFGGSATLCSSQALSLRMPPGYLAYQWERNGQIISGATSSEFNATATGQYRGRFSRISSSPSENQWNEWSAPVEVTEGETPVATIRQQGTVVLKDLNGSNEVVLESENEAAHYYWYRNGSLLDLPGDQDDTLRTITLKPSYGNGQYTLIVSGYTTCRSDASAPKHVFFNDQAPLNLTAPSGLKTTATTASSATLSWDDNSTGELGFEIWRRRKTESGFEAWQLAGLTQADTRSFADIELLPKTQYEYKVRAVGQSGRSEYAPSSALIVTTPADQEPPSPPIKVKTDRTGIHRTRLLWNMAEDNAGISHYIVNYNGASMITADTVVLIENLAINTRYDFSVVAVDHGGNKSNPATAFLNTSFTGLFYEHLPGHWPILDSINWELTEYRGFIPTFSLDTKTQEDYFGFRFDGYLYIHQPGTYRFRTISNDGSRMFLNGTRVVNNDGRHEVKSIESTNINLNEGPQRIVVEFFDYADLDSLGVQFRGPDTGNEWTTISSEHLRSSLVVSNEPADGEAFIVNVFPNPVNGDLVNVLVMTDDPAPVAVDVFDSRGLRITEAVLEKQNFGDVVQMRANALNTGLYIIRVTQRNLVVQRKLVVKR